MASFLSLKMSPIVAQSLQPHAAPCDSHHSRKWQTADSPRRRTTLPVRHRECFKPAQQNLAASKHVEPGHVLCDPHRRSGCPRAAECSPGFPSPPTTTSPSPPPCSPARSLPPRSIPAATAETGRSSLAETRRAASPRPRPTVCGQRPE